MLVSNFSSKMCSIQIVQAIQHYCRQRNIEPPTKKQRQLLIKKGNLHFRRSIHDGTINYENATKWKNEFNDLYNKTNFEIISEGLKANYDIINLDETSLSLLRFNEHKLIVANESDKPARMSKHAQKVTVLVKA